MDTERQIKQMINFIMQEAHEKVNEIRIKVFIYLLICSVTRQIFI